MKDPREILFSAIRDQRVTACIYTDQDGRLWGMEQALAAARELGLQVAYAQNDGADLLAGDLVMQIEGTPFQITCAEEQLMGCLAKTSGVATAAQRFVQAAGPSMEIVCGALKKIPASQREAVRSAIVAGGARCRMCDMPMIYLDKNYVAMLGGVQAALSAAAQMPERRKVIQIGARSRRGDLLKEAWAAIHAGADILYVDTGRMEDAAEVVRAVRPQLTQWQRDYGYRSVKIAYAGGVLAFGIPEYRLPRDVLAREVAVIEQAGVQIHLNTEVGKDIAFDTLRQENDAVYIATGTQFSKTANIPGEDMDGVYHGLDFLRDVHLGHGPDVAGKRVVVVGGGNTAIDAARTAIRGKAQSVTILYRRREIDMPADPREVLEAKEEGIQLAVLAAPLAFTGDGKVETIRCVRMALGEKGSDGRRTTHPIAGDEFDLAADAVIVAVSQYSDFPFIGKDEVEMSEWGELKVDDQLMTTMDGVFAGGDVMRGSDTAITAIADGKHAAQYISAYLGLAAGINQGAEMALPDKDGHVWNRDNVGKMPCLAPETRICSQAEVALGLSEEQTKAESERCYRCSGRATVDPARCIDCQLCWEHCAHDAITMQPLEQDVMRMHPGIRLDQLDDYLEVCKKAHIMPDELICNCTFTMASEIVGAIFDGAHTMEDVSVATAVRGGCGIYCSQAILRLLESAGYPQTVRNDGGWYKIDVNLWNIPEEVLDKDPCLQLRKHQQNLWSDELFAQHAGAFKKSLEAKQQ